MRLSANYEKLHRNLSDENEKSHELPQSLMFLIYTYRAYGYIINSQSDVSTLLPYFRKKALSDLTRAAKIKSLDGASLYNKFIAQAQLKLERKDLAGVLSLLQ